LTPAHQLQHQRRSRPPHIAFLRCHSHKPLFLFLKKRIIMVCKDGIPLLKQQRKSKRQNYLCCISPYSCRPELLNFNTFDNPSGRVAGQNLELISSLKIVLYFYSLTVFVGWNDMSNAISSRQRSFYAGRIHIGKCKITASMASIRLSGCPLGTHSP